MMPHPLTAIDDRLADECIAHLARELSVLETQRATLLDVNAALLQHNVTRFEHAAARQDEAAEMGVQQPTCVPPTVGDTYRECAPPICRRVGHHVFRDLSNGFEDPRR